MKRRIATLQGNMLFAGKFLNETIYTTGDQNNAEKLQKALMLLQGVRIVPGAAFKGKSICILGGTDEDIATLQSLWADLCAIHEAEEKQDATNE